MSKGFSLFKTALVSAATAAVVTWFLRTEKGQETKKKVVAYAKEYQADPAQKHAQWTQKAQEWSKQAQARFLQLKDQWQNGEWTAEDLVSTGKEKAQAFSSSSQARFQDLKAQLKEQGVSTKELWDSLKDKVASSKKASTTEEIVSLEAPEVVSEEITIDLIEEEA